jgi:hypothetical protein
MAPCRPGKPTSICAGKIGTPQSENANFGNHDLLSCRPRGDLCRRRGHGGIPWSDANRDQAKQPDGILGEPTAKVS